MDFSTLKVEVTGHVAIVTLDRPPVNALNYGMQHELTQAFDAFSDRRDVRAIILTGAGRVFCAGVDLKARVAKPFGEGERWANARSFREAKYAIQECKKPVIAAINGPALGGGMGIATCCDILMASTNAQLGLPEVDVGLLGGYSSGMRFFSRSLLRRMTLTGYRVSSAELYRLGIVEGCFEPDDLMPQAMAIAREIASKSPAAVQLAKHTANTVESMPFREGYRFEQNMTAELSKHPHSEEAMRAFAERRPANFDGGL